MRGGRTGPGPMAGKSIMLLDGEGGLCARAVRFFGGRDGKTLFITASKGLYGLSMRVRGAGSQ